MRPVRTIAIASCLLAPVFWQPRLHAGAGVAIYVNPYRPSYYYYPRYYYRPPPFTIGFFINFWIPPRPLVLAPEPGVEAYPPDAPPPLLPDAPFDDDAPPPPSQNTSPSGAMASRRAAGNARRAANDATRAKNV